MRNGQTARRFHDHTSNMLRRREAPSDLISFTPMDPRNRPAPFKRYPDAPLQSLPTRLAPDASIAIDALAGIADTEPVRVDTGLLARLLFFATGVTRVSNPDRDPIHFRAAASAGNLHPLETYVVTPDLAGLEAGVYHLAPDAFGLEKLRSGDYRGAVADAAVAPDLRRSPAILVITGVPWRTAWKYGERGLRHVYWDTGTMLANLLTMADGYAVPIRLLLGFKDDALCRLLDVDGVQEFPVAIAALSGDLEPDLPEAEPAVEDLGSLVFQAKPLSPDPIEFPLITEAQAAGNMSEASEVTAWREAGHSGLLPATSATETPADEPSSEPVDPEATPDEAFTEEESLESVILRRGSTRVMRHETTPNDVLLWALACAIRPVPVDVLLPGTTLLSSWLSIHSVDGLDPGRYSVDDGELYALETTSEREARATAAHVCLDQALGGDSAYTLFSCADLDATLDVLGDRGYRVAQTEAGIVAGRLQLAAFALGYGATGLTFYDDAVQEVFDCPECMMVCAVGVPDYTPVPGGGPGRPAELTRMDHLARRLQQRISHYR